MIKALLIDDEKHCIFTLEYILDTFENIEVVATTQDSTTAKALIEKYQPDIVFLDIEMPKMNGFDVINQFESIPFKVVFTTAYDQYAIKALKINALDYLLKPIDEDDILQVIEKYQKDDLKISKQQVSHLQQFTNGKMQDTIAISTQDGLLFVKIDDMMYLEADGCYTFITMNDKSKHFASKTLSAFEDVLQDNSLFFRAHKSHIVNLKYIKQYNRGEGGELIMLDGSSISLSRNKKTEFMNLFRKI